MLKNIAIGVALFTTMWFVPVAAETGRQDATVIRTIDGARYEIPAGWEWIEFNGGSVTIQHLGTKSGEKGKESSPNRFNVGVSYVADYDGSWDRIDLDERRSYPSGVSARWRAGVRYGLHYYFIGEATIGSKALGGRIVTGKSAPLDVNLVAAAFLRVAETLREVPKSAVLYHPSLGIAADRLNENWYNQFGGSNIAFRCWADGISGNTWIYTYPSSKVFPDTRQALADITGYYAKNGSLKIGNVQRAEVPGGEVLWTEQPGTQTPFLAAVRRDGRYFFLSVGIDASPLPKYKCKSDALREDFLAVAKSVRAWDGK